MAETAAIISGFKWLAPVVTELLKKGFPFIAMDVDEKLRDLEIVIIPQMKMLVENAENCSQKDHLHGWLKSVEEAVYEAEEVLDLHDYYRLEQEVKRSAEGIMVCLEFLLSLIKDLLFSVELKKSLMKLENTAAKAKKFLPLLDPGISNVRGSQTATESGRRSGTAALIPYKVFGRDKERDHIVHLLHETAGFKPESSSAKYSVIAIVGLGGAGKTTLVQYIWKYEKEAETKHFDVIMWVHVSQIFDVKELTRLMMESASKEECSRLDNLHTLQEKLEGYLRLKKFLLVLDNVWSKKEVAKHQWKQLLAPLRVGNSGSKILITTRERGVAEALCARNILDLEELETKDFLSLFMYYAFGDAKIDDDKLYEELEEIVRQNAPKLHGSPLAARMVGSQLSKRPDVDVWKRVLSGDLLKDTMKSLLWSYQNLEAHLQRCFSYCSLFSKGQKIRRKKLIHMWVAEGFIKTVDESKRIEDIGQDYFDELLSSSFFQPTEDDDLYTIHVLLHDLAEMVSKDRCLRVEGNPTEVVVPQEICHLSLRIDTLRDLVEKICNLKNLRTLIFLTRTEDDYCIGDLLHIIFVKLKNLRVVDLGEFELTELPKSIGALKHLRYLDLHKSSFEILPDSIYTLYHLEFLYIDECTFVAKGLANWKKMHHLCCSRMILNVAGIRSLKQLENLRKFQGLSMRINGLENVKEKGEDPVEIKGIEELCLEWSTTDNISRSSDMDAQVLEGLHPPRDLHRLQIEGYQGCRLPSWMVGDRYLLHSLISLELIGCQQLKQLPIISPTLADLTLRGCPKLAHAETKLGSLSIEWFVTDAPSLLHVLLAEEALASLPGLRIEEFKEESFRSEEEQVFQHLTSLQYLRFESCGIKSLPNNLESLPSLEQLSISNCPNITSLPDLPRSLSELRLTGCNPVLKGRCQEPDGQDWSKISHIPRVFL